MARTLSNIKKRHYRILHRTPESFSIPADAAAFSTFLATFTELGYCEDKTLESNIKPAEKISLDDGSKLAQGFNGDLKGTLLQSAVADYTAVETIEDTAQDILLYAEDTGTCIFYPEAKLSFEESVKSGEVEKIPFSCEKENFASKSDFRTRFDEPTS